MYRVADGTQVQRRKQKKNGKGKLILIFAKKYWRIEGKRFQSNLIEASKVLFVIQELCSSSLVISMEPSHTCQNVPWIYNKVEFIRATLIAPTFHVRKKQNVIAVYHRCSSWPQLRDLTYVSKRFNVQSDSIQLSCWGKKKKMMRKKLKNII